MENSLSQFNLDDIWKLIELGFKNQFERGADLFQPDAKIPGDFAQAMVSELDDFKKSNPSSEVLQIYEFSVESQKKFIKRVDATKPEPVILHLGIVNSKNFCMENLISDNTQIQYIFQFGHSDTYHILLNCQQPIEIDEKKFIELTQEYKTSALYQHLNKYIERKTEGIFTENTQRIKIDDIEADTNEIYNRIKNHSPLSTIYVYPTIQTLDAKPDTTVKDMLKSALQLFSFGVIMSTEQDLTSSTAIVDDRHYHCPPNLC